MRPFRPTIMFVGAAIALAAAAFALPAAQDRLLYNHSPSVPVGFYVRIDAPPGPGAFVTVRASDVAPAMARARRFDGPRDRFLKRVAAQAGDRVCGEGAALVINRGQTLRRRSHDSQGAALPAWNGCRTLADNEYLLLGDTDDSFDGRYWGPVAGAQIEGVWRPL